METATAITVGTKVRIEKGCKAREVTKGATAVVSAVREMGAEHGHFVAVSLKLRSKTVTFYARHINRLSDSLVNLNDGNPLHKIQIRKP